jgi:hypothetical protein
MTRGCATRFGDSLSNPGIGQGQERTLGGQHNLLITETGPQSIIYPTSYTSVDPQAITINGGVMQSPEMGAYLANQRSNILFQIIWGVGGANFTAEIDAHRGFQVCIAATSVQVNCLWAEPPQAGLTPESAQCYANISYGTRPSKGNVTRTYPLTQIFPTAVAEFEVPPFAYSLNIFSPDQTFYAPGNSTVEYRAIFGNAASQLLANLSGSDFASAYQGNNGIQLPGYARTVRVLNVGVVPWSVVPVFSLRF